MVYLRNCLPVVLGGAVLMATVSPVLAKTPAEIQAIAKAATVKIEYGNEIGTGVIVHKQGQVYSLITNRHVVCGGGLCNKLPPGRQYRLSLPDGQKVQVNAKNIKLLGQELDLAAIQFSSDRSYPVARIAASGRLKVNDAVFTAGFPLEFRKFGFSEGKAIAVVNRRIQGDKGGYGIIYDAPTLPGMSGGGVFNQDGELVAVHGYGDRYKKNTDLRNQSKVDSKIGYNRGIPIRWLVQGLGEIGIIVGGRQPLSTIRVSPNQKPEVADEYFIAGFNKFVEPGDNIIAEKKRAIQQFTKAIQLNPNYAYAYFMRAYTYEQIGDIPKALADFNQVIALRPDYSDAYNNRGFLKDEKLNDSQGALADFNQAIALRPDHAAAYNNRGNLKYQKLNDPEGALADYNKAITLDPEDAYAYTNRGSLKYQKLNDPEGALADYNKAITFNPDFAEAYANRGSLKYRKLNDPQGALADYNKAISLLERSYRQVGPITYALNPGYVLAYYNRGNLKDDLNDPQGALADYNQEIALKPDFAEAYNNRGILKKNELNGSPGSRLRQREGAIADLRQAAKLFREQGKTQYLQMAIEQLRSLGASE
jgi:tetratricopeptide (TPR) repeat protein